MEDYNKCNCPTCGETDCPSINPEAVLYYPTHVEELHGRDRNMFELGWDRAIEWMKKKEKTGR